MTVMLLVCSGMAQNALGKPGITRVSATAEGAGVRVEVVLTSAVQPAVQTAEHPDRILLDFPGTIAGEIGKAIAVNANGVRQVRIGQHSVHPLVTRVVVDLAGRHEYSLKTEAGRIVLVIGAAVTARKKSEGAPAAAASGSLIGIFRRRQQTPGQIAMEDASAAPTPPVPPPTVASGGTFQPEPGGTPLPQPPTSLKSAPPPETAPQPSARAALPANSAATQVPTEPAATVPTAAASNIPASPDRTSPSNSEVVAAKNEATAPGFSSSTSTPSEPVASSPASVAPAPIAVSPAPTVIARSDDPSLRTVFKVKYVGDGVAYLEGGRAQGLTEGMKLEVEETNVPARQGDSAVAADPRVVAELEVSAVAETSAVTEIHSPKRPVKVGDLAYLSRDDADALVQQRALGATRQYPAVISFTEGDTLDEEVREEVPRPPLPSVNRARGRIGFDTIETISHGTSSVTSSDVGLAFRGDITRIAGTYWNLSGYWRGRLTKESAAAQQTLQDLINRTYHLNMTYDNPNSALVAGFGRLYLPWAPSLDTIDGGYFGRRLAQGATVGIFGGSTPDPSSWDYSPNRAIAGAFINFTGGEYDGLHYSTTTGAGLGMVNWASNDPFIFFEDSISYKRDIAIYESAQLDSPKGNTQTPAPGPGLGRNFFTLRVNPHPRVELDANYNYFREIPSFDPTLVGTGLLDKYLFQGFSGGARVEIFNQFWISATLGRSSGTGDTKSSLNQMYGISYGRVPWLKLRADVHYSRFNSSFGSGQYDSLSLSRQMSDRLRIELLIGQQAFASPITLNTHSKFLTGTVETTLGPHYYLQTNFTSNRGDMSYDQFMISMGYRFDSKRKGE